MEKALSSSMSRREQEGLRLKRFSRIYKRLMQTLEESENYNVNCLEANQEVSEIDLENAYKLLETEEPGVHKEPICSKVIQKSIDFSQNINHQEMQWYLPTYIQFFLRSCILNHDWDGVTHLLLMLLKQNKMYISHAKRVAFLNFLKNPSDADSEILEEFLQLCFVQLKSSSLPPPYDICYGEVE